MQTELDLKISQLDQLKRGSFNLGWQCFLGLDMMNQYALECGLKNSATIMSTDSKKIKVSNELELGLNKPHTTSFYIGFIYKIKVTK